MRLRTAFTLIEVMAIVALLGLLAGATAWSLASDGRRLSRDNAMAQVAQMDSNCRVAARRMGREGVLHVDMDRQRVWRSEEDSQSQGVSSHVLILPEQYRIDRVWLSDADASVGGERNGRGGVVFERGMLRIPCAPTGCTMTYALRWMDVKSGSAVWVVVAGLTGQATLIQHEEEIENLFSQLATGRPDAH